MSPEKVFGEPDDQVVIDGDLQPFAQGSLGPACAPAVRDVAAASIQPLSRALLVEQAHCDTQGGDAPVAGQPLDRIHQHGANAVPTERLGHRELVDQRNAAS